MPDFVDGDDVRVLQARGDTRFAQEPLSHALRQAEPRIHDLDGHTALQPSIECEVNNRHSSTAELAFNFIHATRGEAETLEQRVGGSRRTVGGGLRSHWIRQEGVRRTGRA